MEPIKKLDIKSWFIIILGVALIIAILFNKRNKVDSHTDELKTLHEENINLIKKNDSLNASNIKIDKLITSIGKKIDENTEALSGTKKELQELKKKQNEIPNYVNHLSANDISNAFSDFLNKSRGTR